MKKILIFLTALFLSTTVFAEDVTLHVEGNLNKEQRAQLQLAAAKQIAENTTPATTTASSLKEWVDIGTAVGSGLASSAKELGVATNDFAQTPVGKLTAVLIVWHFLGNQLIHIAFGALWLTTLVPGWIYMFRRQFFEKTVTYFEKEMGPKGARKVVTFNAIAFRDYDATPVLYWVTLIAILVSGLVIIFTA